MAEDDAQEAKDGVERRVYNLPANLLKRLRAFQLSQGISSEAEAARRLLDTALQMRDSVDEILLTLKSRFTDEKDLRVLASDVLAKHALVTKILLSDDHVDFELRDGDWGRIMHRGTLYYRSRDDDEDNWRPAKEMTRPPVRSPAASVRTVPSWEPSSGDLDDDIPF